LFSLVKLFKMKLSFFHGENLNFYSVERMEIHSLYSLGTST